MSAMSTKQPPNGSSPSYPVDGRVLVNIEHPGIVKDVDRAISSLGGLSELSETLCPEPDSDGPRLRLTESAFDGQPIRSHQVDTCNLLLKVTVPKRTGRKRKCGSEEPFHFPNEPTLCKEQETIKQRLFRSLRDNPDSSVISAIGLVEKSFRFRAQADFRYSSASNPMRRQFEQAVLPGKYEAIKKMKYDLGIKGPEDLEEMVPPPFFALTDTPYNYAYQQSDTTGAPAYSMTQHPDDPRVFTRYRTQTMHIVPYDADPVPIGAPPWLVPEEQTDAFTKKMIAQLRVLLVARPVITRRAAFNALQEGTIADLRHALPYAGYMFKSGPWRDALVVFGTDPRTEVKYAQYQTFFFQLKGIANIPEQRYYRLPKAINAAERPRDSHVFDGRTVQTDGSIWQMCDLKDPELIPLLEQRKNDICDIKENGWFDANVMAKLKDAMRKRIVSILESGKSDSAQGRSRRAPDVEGGIGGVGQDENRGSNRQADAT